MTLAHFRALDSWGKARARGRIHIVDVLEGSSSLGTKTVLRETAIAREAVYVEISIVFAADRIAH